MSNTIDNRVVSLEFDNARFERNARESMSTLDKLKEKLHFKGAAEGLAEIESASENVDMGGLSGAVDAVKVKFSALETVAVGALMNIGSKAVDAGAKLVKSLSLDQITAGFDKYAQKTSSVQTILNATRSQGEDMESVTEQLEKLNWFTDETSYSFTDMVENIGKFTSNGVLLEDAVEAMEGIATWAGISGANVQQASHAMYNLSQAMGVGYVQLIDWKSIENAQMATREFKQMAINAALARGTIEDIGDGYYSAIEGGDPFNIESFNTALSKGKWLTRNVLTDVLKNYSSVVKVVQEITDEVDISTSALVKYALEYQDGTIDMAEASERTGLTVEELTDQLEKLSDEEYNLGLRAFKAAQESRTFADVINYTKDAVSSGWMNTFEKLFGNYEESVNLWSSLSESMYTLFVEAGEDRNKLLQEWYELGGRDKLIGGLMNIVDSFVTVFQKARKALSELFPISAKQLLSITEGFEKFTSKLVITEETGEKIKNVFKGVFSVFKVIWEVIKAAGTVLRPFVKLAGKVIEVMFGAASGVGEMNSSFVEWLTGSEGIAARAEKIAQFLEGIPARLSEIFKSVTGMEITDVLQRIGNRFRSFVETIKGAFQGLKKVDTGAAKAAGEKVNRLDSILTWIVEKATKAWGILKTVGGKIKEAWEFVRDYITESPIFQQATAKIQEWFQKFQEFDFSKIQKKTEDSESFFDKITKVFEKVKDFFKAVKDFITGGAKDAWDGATKFFDTLKADIKNFDLGDVVIWAKKIKRTVDIVLEIVKGIAVVMLLFEIRNLVNSLTDTVKTVKGAISSAKTLLDTVTKKISGKPVLTNFQKVADAFQMIAVGVAIVAASIWALSTIKDVDAFYRATAVVGGIIAALGALAVTLVLITRTVAKIDRKSGLLKKKEFGKNSFIEIGIGLLAMSIGVAVVANALVKMAKAGKPGDMLLNALAVGGIFAVMGAVTTLIAVFAKNNKNKGALLTAAALILVMSISVSIIARALRKMVEKGNVTELDKASNILLKLVAALAGIFAVAAVLSMVTKGIGALGIVAVGAAMIAAGFAFIEIADAISKISESLKVIGEMGSEELVQALMSLIEILKALAITTIVLGISPWSVAGALGAIEVAYAIQKLMEPLESLFWMVLIDWHSLDIALGDLTGLMWNLAGVTDVLGLFPSSVIGAAGAIEVTYAVKELMGPLGELYSMTSTDWHSLDLAVGDLSGLMWTLAGVTDILALFPTSVIGAAGAIEVAYAMNQLMPPLKTISGMTWDEVDAGVKGFKKVLWTLSGTLTFSGGPFAVFKYIKAAAIAKVAEVLSYLPTISDYLQSLAGTKWSEIKTPIKAMKEVFDILEDTLKSGIFESANQFFNPIGSLLGSGSKYFKASAIVKLSEALDHLAPALEKIGKISSDDLEIAASNIGKALTTLKDVLNENLWDSFDWIDDLTSGSRANAIATLVNTIPSLTDSIASLLMLDANDVRTTLDILGSAFSTFGEAIATGGSIEAQNGIFGVGLKLGFTTKSQGAADAITSLIHSIDEMTISLPPFIDIMNDKGPENVEKGLTLLGTGFKDFADAVDMGFWSGLASGASAKGVGALIGAIESLTTNLPGFMALFDDVDPVPRAVPSSSGADRVKTALTILGEGFQGFATALKEAGNVLTGAYATEKAGGIKMMVDSIAPFIDAIEKMAGTGLTNLQIQAASSTLKTVFQNLGTGLQNFASSNWNKWDPDKGIETFAQFSMMLDAVSEVVAKIIPIAAENKDDKKLPNAIREIGEAISDFAEDLKSLGDVEVDTSTLEEMGLDLATAFNDSLNKELSAGATTAKRSIANLVAGCYAVIVNPMTYDKFYRAGKYITEGLKQGLLGGSPQVESAMGTVVHNMTDALTDPMLMASPSRLMAKYGRFIDLGLAAGIEEYSYKVTTASGAMAEGAIDAAQKPIEQLNDIFGDDMRTTMTITPVLDLSEIQNDRAMLANSLNGIGIGTSVHLADQNAAGMSRRASLADRQDATMEKLTGLIRDLVDNPPSVNNNEFNITNGDPEEVADAVERRLTRDIVRRNAVWGR